VANANFFMGLFWLALGVGLIVAHAFHPEYRALRLLGTDLSLGWAGVLLSLYNFVRWYSMRSREYERREMEASYERRLRAAERRLRGEDQEPDPNFDFSDRPPNPDRERPDASG
jgi:uncharacterized membrane protein (DUF485 family)